MLMAGRPMAGGKILLGTSSPLTAVACPPITTRMLPGSQETMETTDTTTGTMVGIRCHLQVTAQLLRQQQIAVSRLLRRQPHTDTTPCHSMRSEHRRVTPQLEKQKSRSLHPLLVWA